MNKFSAPGFIDLQVNGFMGIDFSSENLTVDQIRDVTAELIKRGIVGYCPTMVTSPDDVYKRNLPIFRAAYRDPFLSKHLLGIHLEGPFISKAEGARGCHPLKWIKAPAIEKLAHWLELSGHHISLLTVDPEAHGIDQLITFACANGIRVSLGHHAANHTQIKQAIQSGATLATHLGNALPPMIPKMNNALFEQLAEDRLMVMLVTDGYHLSDSFTKVAIRAKTAQRLMIVSDSAPFAGCSPGRYHWLGHDIKLDKHGQAKVLDQPYLAGSAVSMEQCMQTIATMGLLSAQELWSIGFYNQVQVLRLKLYQLQSLDCLSATTKAALFSFMENANKV